MAQRKPFNTGNYTSLAIQWIIGIALFLYAGIQIDQYLSWNTPIATWLLPLFFITGMIVKMIVDTGNKK